MANIVPLTNEIYWASKSPAINAMYQAILAKYNAGGGTGDADAIAQVAAETLALAGRTGPADLIDVPIMVWNWDPVLIMQRRLQIGYAWVPSALCPPIEVAPGFVAQGQPSYNPAVVPPLSILVSVNAADYPPYKAPVPATA